MTGRHGVLFTNHGDAKVQERYGTHRPDFWLRSR
jgi:hypothetical protein